MLAVWLAMSAMSSARYASINCTVGRSAVLAWARCSLRFAFWNCPCCFAKARRQTTLPQRFSSILPLSLPNVLPSLQSGLIDACYGTPLTVLALQWFTKVKYRTSLSITNVMGALVLSDTLWQQLSADQQKLVRETVRKYNAKAVTNMRQYETKALTLLQTTAGIETITVAEEEVARLQQVSEQVRQELVGKLYPQESLDRVLALRDAYRQKQQKD